MSIQHLALKLLGGFALVSILVANLHAQGNLRHALVGTWHVRCPKNKSHVDVVRDGTRQHKCESCGEQCFVKFKVTVMCKNGHANEIDLANIDVIFSHKCKESGCRLECQGW